MSQPDLRGLCPLLQVFDMPRSLHFYAEVLGFAVVTRSPTYAVEGDVELFHWVLLRRDATELMLNTAYDEGERPAAPPPQRVASHADLTLYFDCPDLDAAYAHLQTHSVPCSAPEATSHGMRQISLRDPDGFGITLHRPASQV